MNGKQAKVLRKMVKSHNSQYPDAPIREKQAKRVFNSMTHDQRGQFRAEIGNLQPTPVAVGQA